MSHENTDKKAEIAGAFLLGALIGAALGVIFAPDKGSETRKKMSASASGLADELKDLLNGLFDAPEKPGTTE